MSAFAIPTGNDTEAMQQEAYLIACRNVGKLLEEGRQQIWLIRIIASVLTHFAGRQNNLFLRKDRS